MRTRTTDDQPEDDQPDNLTLVQRQFRRQAEAYSTMKVVTDPRILDNMVEISAVRADSRVLDVACGPGFVAMACAQVPERPRNRRNRHDRRPRPRGDGAPRNFQRHLRTLQRRANAV